MVQSQEQALRSIAREVAYEDWDRSHGFGLYHANEETQKKEFERAYKKVQKWFTLLAPAYTAKASEVVEAEYETIDDSWGSSGWAAAEHLKTKL